MHMTRGLLPLLTLAGLSLAAVGAESIYVSPLGDDAGDGSAARPYLTLGRAREAVRQRIREGLPAGGLAVELAAGRYHLPAPLELTAEDSGTVEAPIVWRSLRGVEARLLGGVILRDIEPVTDPAILARLAPEARDQVRQVDLAAAGVTDLGDVVEQRLELYQDDLPLTLARWPNEGFVRIAEEAGGEKFDVRGTKGDRIGRWRYEDDRPDRWVDEPEVWVHGYWFWDWADQRHRVKAIDRQEKILEVEPPYHSYGYRKGQWYYAFNLLAELDAPGEYYLDRTSSILYFWPTGPLRDAELVLSGGSSLVTMKDCRHVALWGLTLEACRGNAITISGGEACLVSACVIRNTGASGVSVNGGQRHRVEGCDVYQNGVGGVLLSGGDRQTLTGAGHVAYNNYIHQYGRWKRMYSPGIALHGVGLRAHHNLIADAPHQAIAFSGNDHVMEFNEIHSVCYESNDAGAIYAGRDWSMYGTVIRHNYLHHIKGLAERGCVGVYLDDMYGGTEITGNVFWEVTRPAFVGGGRDCLIADNLFYDCQPAVHIDARALNWAAGSVPTTMIPRLRAVPFDQPPYSIRYPTLPGMLDDEPAAPKGNVVERNISIGGTFDGIYRDARPFVTIRDNWIDPAEHGLLDPAHGDFRMRSDSPLLAAGATRPPFERMGLVNDDTRASWPVRHPVRRAVSAPPDLAPARPKGPRPVFQVGRTSGRIAADGKWTPSEWRGVPADHFILLAQDVGGDPAGPPSRAWVAHDGTRLYFAVEHEVAAEPALRTTAVWGQDDAVELAFRYPPDNQNSPILVLRGYPDGTFVSSDESGAPEAAVRRAAEGVAYGVTIRSRTQWDCEWSIPLASLGFDGSAGRRLAFSLTVRKSAQPVWLMWEGTRTHSWRVDQAGLLDLAE